MKMEKITPAAPIAPWLGGKKKLNKTLIERIDRIEHSAYIEPFVGMGGVFLRRSWRPKTEVMNDYNGEIINLFRVLQRHYLAFMDYMRFQVASRREFERLRSLDPSTLTDLERAGRFLYLQRQAFGGQVNGVFGVSPNTGPRFSLSKLEPILDAVHERLEGVVFENLDWADLIRRYDHDGALFYLDPPYFGGEADYGKDMFERDDFARIADQMKSIKGKFIMSINDTPEIREIFQDFYFDEVRLTYSVAKSGGNGKVGELIVSSEEVRPSLL